MEWPPVCESLAHIHKAIPAVDKYTHHKAGSISLCSRCSERLGPTYVRHGFQFTRIPYQQGVTTNDR